MRSRLRAALASWLMGSLVLSGPACVNPTSDPPQVDSDGPRTGGEPSELLRAAREDRNFKEAIAYVAESGFDTENPETVALTDHDGAPLVMTMFNSLSAPRTDAALIAYEPDREAAPVTVELITVDRAALEHADTLNAGAFFVTASRSFGPIASYRTASPGKSEYFGCMMFCIGASCAHKAVRCRVIPFIGAMLACMAAVCGTKTKACHRICRPRW